MAQNDRITRKVTQDNFITEKIDVIENNLLGTYDVEGNYTIAPQIIKELINIDKVKRTTFGNSVFCVGNLLGYGEIVFELLFDAKTRNGKSASATLYVLEDVDKINGYLQNTIKTKLEDFSEVVENFIEATHAHFNIKTSESDDDDEDDAEVLERKLGDDLDSEDSYIIAKKQFSLMLDRLLEEKFLDAYGKYFTSRIALLTKLDNDFSTAVLDSFYRQYSLIQNVFLQEQNYKCLNELLDKCFEEFSGTSAQFLLQENEYNRMIQPSLDSFVSNVNKLNEKYENKALHMLGKGDRKKVEAILEDHEKKEEHPERESKPNVEQIVNAVPKNIYTLDGKTIKEVSEKQEKSVNKIEPEQDIDSEVHFIEEIMKKDSQTTKKDEQQTEKRSFYSAFKEQHASVPVSASGAVNTASNKVVDTSRSEHLDTPNNQEHVAANSLKDRMSRLEKFKEQQPVSVAPTYATSVTSAKDQNRSNMGDEKVGNLFDMLTREKAIKVEQIDSKNRRNREEVDMISPIAQPKDISQVQRENMLIKRNMDFNEMEK